MALTRRIVVAVLLAGAPGPALAHGLDGERAHAPGWTWDPAITIPLAVALLLFAIGWVRLRRRSGLGAGGYAGRACLFAAGWILLGSALVSPLHQLGEHSFAAHMFEHELLMLAAAPLLVLSRPLAIMLWAFPASGRRAIGAASGTFIPLWLVLTAPVVATLLQAAMLWLWHIPAVFDRALASEAWHGAQHLSFLISALLFWTAMTARTTPRGTAILCLFATSIVSGALGALMAFAGSPWYARYAAMGLAPFGLSPIEDQQFAGLLMWIPGGLVHAGAALVLLNALLRPERGHGHAG